MTELESPARLLFVDDDPESCRAFARTARGLGYVVDTALTPGAAVALARTHDYPVVVTDLYLQGSDGYAVIDAVGSLRPDTTYLIVTGHPHAFHASRVESHGAIASLMPKPWDQQELAEKLAFAMKWHKRRRTARQVSAPAESLSLLIVEDSPSDSFLLRQLIASIENLEATLVGTLAEATRLLHERTFDVVMTDLALPDAQGADTVFRLRSASPESAIVVCSGNQDDTLCVQLVQVGAHEYLSKAHMDRATVVRAVQVARERKAFEQRLRKMAYYDPLTGVYNRAGWQERTANAVGRASRRGEQLMVAAIDLDRFKSINDELGHDAGDATLQEVAHRMQNLIREYDTLARLGGDEFALMLVDLPESYDPQRFGDRIVSELSRPVQFGNVGYDIGASVGVAIFPMHGRSITSLLKAADTAMYQAKSAGRGLAVVATAERTSRTSVL